MPRPKAPPTPAGSTDLKGSEKTLKSTDMESSFLLPPPALRAEGQPQTSDSKPTISRTALSSTPSGGRTTPPISPKSKAIASSPRQKRTSSGIVKLNSVAESPSTGPDHSSPSFCALPPPPSRARKIIQMKPKSASSQTQSSPDSDASYQPRAASTVSTQKPSTAVNAASAGSNSKRKQPSATSAAGRKIARKTAHSIIERRRRSKMNEEFGVLKDMIPACEGVEMHKLAILQAGIEYVRYLEGCVAQLKERNGNKGEPVPLPSHPQENQKRYDDVHELDEDSDDNDKDEDEDDVMGEDFTKRDDSSKGQVNNDNQSRTSMTNLDEWSFRESRNASVASQSSSAYPSPYLHSQPKNNQAHHHQQDMIRGARPVLPTTSTGSFSASPSQMPTHSSSAASTLITTSLSPVFNSIHFSPDLIQTQTNASIESTTHSGSLVSSSSGSWSAINHKGATRPSPQMPPLPSPKAAMHLPLPPLASCLHLPQPFHMTRESTMSPAGMSDGSGTAEATATAALMMLTNDWRAGAGAREGAGSRDLGGIGQKGKGMSVRDLLSS